MFIIDSNGNIKFLLLIRMGEAIGDEVSTVTNIFDINGINGAVGAGDGNVNVFTTFEFIFTFTGFGLDDKGISIDQAESGPGAGFDVDVEGSVFDGFAFEIDVDVVFAGSTGGFVVNFVGTISVIGDFGGDIVAFGIFDVNVEGIASTVHRLTVTVGGVDGEGGG